MTRFFVVPQWQGSPAARAMHLADGAEAIAGDLPRAATVRVEVPSSAGESLDTGIRRFSTLTRVRDALADALAGALGDATTDAGASPVTTPTTAGDVPTDAGASPAAGDAAGPAGETPVHDVPIVVGGDCGVAVPAIAHAAARHERLAVVWFDAHGDLNAPESSPSGALAGMALRAVFDELPLPGSAPVPADRVILAGARELDDAEVDLIAQRGLRVVDVTALADASALAEAVAATGAAALYIHVDLDVLDPAAITGVALPVPFGLSLDELVAAIRAARGVAPLVGASIAGFAPASAAAAVDDLGTILRVVGALA